MKGTRPASIVPLDERRDSPHATASQNDDVPGSCLPSDFPAEILDELTPDSIILLEEYYLLKRQEATRRMYDLFRLHPRAESLEVRHISLNAAIYAKLAALTDTPVTWSEIAEYNGFSRATVMAHAKAMRDKIGQWS